jgi:hypothetical protein
MLQDEREMIDKLADEAEVTLTEDYEKKDRKEQRGVTKQSLYDGSKKLKHSVPKGKLLK